jgi:FtsZ-binding cell division protein ZapB
VQASRQSPSSASDDELVPVAADLMRRLSQANSTIEARQTEVASLQAQNQLLRQQVEQQQAQLENLVQSDDISSIRPAAWGKLVTR